MNKKILSVSISLALSLLIAHAQVGINTQNPRGIFHVDGKGDTSGTANLSDDLIVASDGGNGVNVALGGAPIGGSSVALYSNKKGFLPNRVELKSATDITTVANPQEGMVVYNITASGAYPDATVPGYYIYNGTRWKRLMTANYTGAAEVLTLKKSVSTVPVTSITSISTFPILDFGDITIYNDGAYAFSFNIYATSSTTTVSQGITQGVIYIYIYKKGVGDSDYTLLKTVPVYPALFPNGQSFTITAITGLELKSQDNIIFKTKHENGFPTITFTTARTYVLYWLL